MAIFEERILEQFMPRGMGSSGVASREIQASNLPDLSAAVRTSAMTRQNQEINLKNTLLSQRTSVKPKVAGGMGGPVVIGRSVDGGAYGGGITIAMPNGKGTYDVKTIPMIGSDEKLKSLGVNQTAYEAGNIPILGTRELSGEFSKNQIGDYLLKSTAGNGMTLKISDILNKLPSSTGPVHYAAKKFSVSPSVEDQAWMKERKQELVEEKNISDRNWAARQRDAGINIDTIGDNHLGFRKNVKLLGVRNAS